jgi:hypothetical protein
MSRFASCGNFSSSHGVTRFLRELEQNESDAADASDATLVRGRLDGAPAKKE